MPNHEARFRLLSERFESLVLDMEKCTDPEQRRQSLQRMKVLIDEIDELVLSSLKHEGPAGLTKRASAD
jgi:hypothetical protein